MHGRPLIPLVLFALLAALGGPAAAQYRAAPPPPGASGAASDPTAAPAAVRGLDIEQRLGERLPLDLTFTDETGATVRLGDYFGNGRPVVLIMAYYECPLLCPLVLNGTVDAARAVDGWVPGRDYEIVTVSIDPDETPAIAAERKAETLTRLAMPGAEAGWHFLTGTFQHVDALAAAAGFGYRYIPSQDEYAHGAVLMFASPDGVLTRYLPGTRYPPEQFKLALLDAGEGQVGSLFDQLVIWCFQFDESKGKYTIVAMRVMQLGGLAVLLTLGGLIGFLFVLERKRRGRAAG